MKHPDTDLSSEAARRWRRWLWETAETGQPSADVSFDDAVFEGSDLVALTGEEAYAALVERLVESPDVHEMKAIARELLEAIFPYECRCRRHAAMERDNLQFNGSNVYRSLYFTDHSVLQTLRLLFRRTPDVQLFQCVECGDVWLQALDQVEWIQHLVLIEAGDLKRIEQDGVWPTTMDRFEDAWVLAFDLIGRNSPQLRQWQAANNSAEAFARFGK